MQHNSPSLQALEPPDDLEDHIDDLLLADKPKVSEDCMLLIDLVVVCSVHQGSCATRLSDRFTG